MLAGGKKLKAPLEDDGTYDMVYLAGQGTQVYVFDTGVRLSHESFQGRAFNFPSNSKPGDRSPYVDERMDDTDDVGHGTQ